MAERAAEKTILVDGPMAGHLYQIPEGMFSFFVQVPRPLTVALLENPTALTAPDDTVYYRVETVGYYTERGAGWVRIGWSASQRPDDDYLMDYVPTGLAEQGILPWGEVPATAADRKEPIPVETHGDVLADCGITLRDPAWTWATQIEASCSCGWRTGRVALDRRSQLVRAAHRHALGQDARRERFRLPIRVLSVGAVAQPDCYGGVAVDEPAERVFGRCRRCGWETERVEYFRSGPLRALCQAHTGPDGVRRVRDQLLAAYGLPLADEKEVAGD